MSDTVELFRALADESRLRILNLLSRQELCVCQIVEVLSLGQSKVSRHLAHLKNAGLVTSRRDGLWMHYSLAQPGGRLHRRLIEWFQESDIEVPIADADMKALATLDGCVELCAGNSSDQTSKRHGGCVTVSS